MLAIGKSRFMSDLRGLGDSPCLDNRWLSSDMGRAGEAIHWKPAGFPDPAGAFDPPDAGAWRVRGAVVGDR